MTHQMTPTTFTIDCATCPAAGRLCGDCFVPVLGQVWLQEPAVRQPREPATVATGHRQTCPLDSDELAAVSAFVRAGLVEPQEAALARAELTGASRSAAG